MTDFMDSRPARDVQTDFSTPSEFQFDAYRYQAECLGDVVTLQEASQMWEISESTLSSARLRLRIDGRKALSGGTILLSVRSLIIQYGEPKFDPLKNLRIVRLQEEANE